MPNLVEIVITAKDLATPIMEKSKTSAFAMGGTLDKMGKVSAAALVGIAVASVKMAGDFENSTTRLMTSAGESEKNIDMVRQGMLRMAGQVGMSAEDLSKGMYTVESAGYHGAAGLDVLKASAQGAKDENADLATVANAVTDVLKDYHEPAAKAADVTSQIVAAVSHGKTTMELFSNALANVLPLAGQLHISFADVSGALAEMTSHGMNARRASQNLANAMRELVNPNTVMTGELKKFGYTASDLQDSLSSRGLTGTLQWLADVADKGAAKIGQKPVQALAKLTGSSAALTAALMVSGKNADETNEAIKDIGKASADSSGNVEGFSKIQKNFNQQLSELKASAESAGIEIGDKLIPPLKTLMGFLSGHPTFAKDLLIGFVGLLGVLTAYSAALRLVALAQVLWAGATKAVTAAQWLLNVAMDANPIGLVVIAIAALVAGLIIAWKTSATFRNFVKAAWEDIQKAAANAVIYILKYYRMMINAALEFVDVWIHAAAKAFGWVPGLGDKLKAAANAVDGFKNTVNNKFDSMITKVKSFDDNVNKASKERKLQVNISQWTSNLDKAKASLKSVPDSRKAKVLADIKDLENKIAQAKAELASLRSKTVTVNVRTVTTSSGEVARHGFASGGIRGAASGGPRSGLTLVGEDGPELADLPTGTRIRPSGETRRMLTGEGQRQGPLPALKVTFAGNMDTLFATAFQKALNSGLIKISLTRNVVA
ncbi:MAG TPA: phage tail tape measure protein [Terriglobales bacterium]|nr:phage tail tape measure protein [Terriglobales bacterium]